MEQNQPVPALDFNPNIPPPTFINQSFYSTPPPSQPYNLSVAPQLPSMPIRYQQGHSSPDPGTSFLYTTPPPPSTRSSIYSIKPPPSLYSPTPSTSNLLYSTKVGSHSIFPSTNQLKNLNEDLSFLHSPPPPPPLPSSSTYKVKQGQNYPSTQNNSTVTSKCPFYTAHQNIHKSPYTSTSGFTKTLKNQYSHRYSAPTNQPLQKDSYTTKKYKNSKNRETFQQNNDSKFYESNSFKNNYGKYKWIGKNVTENVNKVSVSGEQKFPTYKTQKYSSSNSKSDLPHLHKIKCEKSSSDSEDSKERLKPNDNFHSRENSRSSSRERNECTTDETEREKLLKTYRSQYCETSEEMTKKLAELADSEEKEVWIRSSPAELFYKRTNNGNEVESTPRLDALCSLFNEELVKRSEKIKSVQEPYKPPERKRKTRICRHKSEKCSSESSDEHEDEEEDCSMEELKKKMNHPYRLHPDLWHNEHGEMNDGPLCRCSVKSRRTGIRHGIYPGEEGYPKCRPESNNSNKLYHYRITISPPTNFLTKTPTMIKYDHHEFLFEGFSLLSHIPIEELPTCKVIRFNIEYRILYIEEKMPEHFTIKELDLFFKFLFHELLELIDFNVLPSQGSEDSCSCFHFLPRFVRDLENNGKEVLAMSEVLKYLLDSSGPLVDQTTLERMMNMTQHDWQDYVDYIKGMVVTNPSKVPCSARVDQLDRNVSDLEECVDLEENGIIYPIIVHFGIRPPQLSYAGNPEYQKARREYVRFRHLLANMSKPTYEDKRKLEEKENDLQRMRTQGRMKRNITIAISSKGFYRTGIMCDIVQHALLIPVLVGHLRFHQSLSFLEKNIDYKFHNRQLLQLALTHPSYKENFGTNPDHARNSLTNCGIRQPEYGDRKIHYMNTRKRGINTLINIMSRFGREHETASNITHNERLEFLGDAVVEFLSSIHLFFMFPDLEEGGLATYRAAIVQNQHLAVLAKKFRLDEFMLYAHGSDLCHELELRHAMANCFEALMGALLLDGGINVADKVFANALYMDNEKLKDVWENYPPHPLQEQEPSGDRQWIESSQVLKRLTKFEDSIGLKFKHIRLLARAFTDRSMGFTHLTLGSNQRLEFLGDTVLQLICSEYLYRYFPEHHEGHLSLLRSSLVNNRTQAVVCDDLGMTEYAIYSNPRAELKTKDRADLLEALLGALYVDKGLEFCQIFCQVCLFPRLQMFIMNQDWNDPKSKLQQCCLTLRTMEGGEPDIPYYKVIQSIGPTNTRVYTVAVYFRSKRLATAEGHSIQQAEMHAAKQALENSKGLFPQLDHQKRVISQSIKRQKCNEIPEDVLKDEDENIQARNIKRFVDDFDESHLPKQYRMREDISSDEICFNSDEDESGSSLYKGETHVKIKKKKKKSHRNKKRRKSLLKSKSVESTSTKPIESSDILDHFRSSILNLSKAYEDRDETDREDKATFENSISFFKPQIEGTEELSSDIESGELI